MVAPPPALLATSWPAYSPWAEVRSSTRAVGPLTDCAVPFPLASTSFHSWRNAVIELVKLKVVVVDVEETSVWVSLMLISKGNSKLRTVTKLTFELFR